MKILVTDDHPLFLDGLRNILLQLEEDVVIETADSAQATIKTITADSTFDLILLDLGMPCMEGLSVLDYIRKKSLWIPTVIVSATDNLRHIEQALEAGAFGFIPKSHGGQNMLDAIKAVLNGEMYLPESIRRQLGKLPAKTGKNTNVTSPELNITQRQHEVLELVAQGYANKKIAGLLALSEHTVKSHLGSVFQALSVTNRTECVQAARDLGIIQAED